MHKIINFKTNYNNKLDCRCFTHIDVASGNGITESQANNTVFEIHTVDKSHPPVKVKIIDIIRTPLWRICNALSYPSHGMESTAFQEMMILSSESMNMDKQMAVYFYEKIN